MATIINERDLILQAATPRLLPVTLPGNITVPPGSLGSGTLPGGVTVPPGNLGNGTLPSGVTVAALQVTGTIQTSQLSANVITTGNLSAQNIAATQITAGTFNVGVVYAGNLSATQITSGTIATSRLAADVITTGNLSAQSIQATQILGGSFVGKTFTGGIFTGAIFRSAATGPRIIIDGNDNDFSIYGYDAHGSVRQFVKFDPSGSAGNSIWGFQQFLPGLTVNGGASPPLLAKAWRVNDNGVWYDTFSPACEGYNQSMGVGLYGVAENNHGIAAANVELTYAPLVLIPQSRLPDNKAAGALTYVGGHLYFSDGADWFRINGFELVV